METKQPLVSVVIPCYRQGRYLAHAVDSALAQSFPQVEVVVVNDGSDDDTPLVASSYGNRIRYFETQNGGAARARNYGAARSVGTHLLFLDADDRLHSDAVVAAVDALRGHEDAVAVLGYRKFTASDVADPVLLTDVRFMPQLLSQNIAPPNCHLVPRTAFDEAGGFDESIDQAGEDWDLWLRLALMGTPFLAVGFAGAWYRRHSEAISTNEMRMLRGRVNVMLRAHRIIVDSPSLLELWGADLAVAEREFHRHCVARELPSEPRQRLWAAICELRSLGFGAPKSRARRVLDAVFGERGEWFAMAYLRWFDPVGYRCYNGCNP